MAPTELANRDDVICGPGIDLGKLQLEIASPALTAPVTERDVLNATLGVMALFREHLGEASELYWRKLLVAWLEKPHRG
jgi:hypothetical protein